MTTPFAAIGRLLEGPRGSGRTHRMIATAPRGARLLASDEQHANYLRRSADALGRSDLSVSVIRDYADAIGGNGPGVEAIPDHFTTMRWLYEAESEIQAQIERGRELEDALQGERRLREQLADALARATGRTLT